MWGLDMIGVAEELALVANACEYSHIRIQQKRRIAWSIELL